jgi:hypothetical protein
MPRVILQINLRFHRLPADLPAAFAPAAAAIAAVPGLRWKTWLVNESTHEAGGHYLFDDDAAAQAYLDGPVIANMKHLPGLADHSIKRFHVLEELTTVTRGPVGPIP